MSNAGVFRHKVAVANQVLQKYRLALLGLDDLTDDEDIEDDM